MPRPINLLVSQVSAPGNHFDGYFAVAPEAEEGVGAPGAEVQVRRVGDVVESDGVCEGGAEEDVLDTLGAGREGG